MPAIRNKQEYIDATNSFAFRGWLDVFARPTVFASLSRMPSREHLLSLLDAYQPFAQSLAGDIPLALALLERMRVLLSGWSPPDLPAEIVDVARALLRADGTYAVPDWDKMDWEEGPDLDPGQTVDQIVVWPPWEPKTMSDDIKWPPLEVKHEPLPSDNLDAIISTLWIMVLASPQVYRALAAAAEVPGRVAAQAASPASISGEGVAFARRWLLPLSLRCSRPIGATAAAGPTVAALCGSSDRRSRGCHLLSCFVEPTWFTVDGVLPRSRGWHKKRPPERLSTVQGT